MSGAASGAHPLVPWIMLAALGALHGVNPGMGWLFAVALGMQQREGRAVRRALAPLAAGHALAVAAAVALAAVVGLVLPMHHVRWLVAAALAALGARQLWRHGHPHWGGMRIGARDLTLWSFLVATAHGAGLMAVPVAVDAGAIGAHVHASAEAAASPGLLALGATAVHTAGYLLVTGLLAVLVYERIGLGALRRAWVNLDRVWAMALLVAAVAVVAL